jgi:transportin-3
VPAGELDALRDQILLLLQRYAAGPKPIRVQLSVCLAILAIQMKDWINVLPDVVAALSSSSESHAAILDFLRVLPEEVTEGRKITLSVRGSRICRLGTHPRFSADRSMIN